MNDLAHFFEMGGYAFYVWSAYVLTIIVLGIPLFIALRRLKHLKRKEGLYEFVRPKEKRRK